MVCLTISGYIKILTGDTSRNTVSSNGFATVIILSGLYTQKKSVSTERIHSKRCHRPLRSSGPLLELFFIICIIAVVGTLARIILTKVDIMLQTFMYFLVTHLNILSLDHVTDVGYKILVNFNVT